MAKKIRTVMQRKTIRYSVLIGETAIVIFILDQILRDHTSFTLAPAFAMIVMSIYHGGTIAGIGSGLIVSAYAIYAVPDPLRAIIIIGSIIAIVAPIVILRQAVDNGDRLLAKLLDLDTYLAGSVFRWENMNDSERWEIIKVIHHKMAHIRTLSRGWHDLAMEREQVLDDAYEDMTRAQE
jgi:hypothetical protein